MTLRLIPITLLAAALYAQGPGGPRMHAMAEKTTAIQSYLNLTSAQITSLQQLKQAERTALKPIFEQMQPLHESLRTEEQSASPNATNVGNYMLQIKALEQQAAPIRASYQQQALAVLTAAQKTQLTALQNAAALIPAIHEAGALNLLTPAEGPDGGPGAMGRGRFGRP